MNSLEQLREACAKVCEERAESRFRVNGRYEPERDEEAEDCAAAIRSIDLTQFERGDKQEGK